MQSTTRQRQRGITLIESLVAMLVTALGILGILGVQMRTLTDTTTTVRRAQAIRLIEDLGERMKVSPNALLGMAAYASGYDQKGADLSASDCASSNCSAAEQAAYDVKQWKTTVQQTLPAGQASIFLAPGETVSANRRMLGVIVAWRENERHDADEDYKSAIDAVPTGGDTNEENTCPEGFTCHLQYVPVSARCAPYASGGAMTVYCS
ncbi:MAG TPA: type IV pilus modification protein PilV [Ottowia sp.]|uniref:type IV pilus modification protein PilV n=1 Tax=Ottowia sp. TaxID=1898956 RepID=UPI002BA0FE3A|nr:type IV pilus modification protein PilV [Ottowia sp.]HMN20322.1 type IV pilus modification protein PilV [Ottowia sp.]